MLLLSRLGHLVLDQWPTLLATLFLTFTLVTLLPLLNRPALPSSAPRLVTGLPLLGSALAFYKRRQTFTTTTHHKPTTETAQSDGSRRSFTTFIGRHPLVCLGGPAGRATFFGARDAELNLFAGYGLLKNGLPPINTGTFASVSDGSRMLDQRMRGMGARLVAVQVREVQARLRAIFENHKRGFGGSDGVVFDPYDEMFRAAYAVNLRQYGADELADDPGLFEWSRTQIETLRSGTGVAQIIVPLLWPLVLVRQVVAGTRLFREVSRIRSRRAETGKDGDDFMQLLIDGGHSNAKILGAIIAALFASYFNVGMAFVWIPLYVATNRVWYKKLQDEVAGVVEHHRTDPSQQAWDVLSTLTLEAWEKEFPVLQLCLHETLRFTNQTSMYRRNTSGRDIPIGKTGEVIPPGAYVAYTMDEVQMDAKIYPDPETWNPGRYEGAQVSSGQEDRYTYVGWGGGRHLCAGLRFAKLIEAIFIAHFVSAFEFEAVDEGYKVTTEQPKMSREGVAPQRKDKVLLRIRQR
ncbi:unnamed protein product [Discula destructiva]